MSSHRIYQKILKETYYFEFLDVIFHLGATFFKMAMLLGRLVRLVDLLQVLERAASPSSFSSSSFSSSYSRHEVLLGVS